MPLPDSSQWKPWTIEKIKTTFNDFEWILAGGFALELFVGKNYRNHADIDILVARENQKKLFDSIDESKIFIAKDGKLTAFEKNRFYEFPFQDVWILDDDLLSWCLQVMLYDVEEGLWIYKREKSIKLRNDFLFWEKEGIKIIKPEIQLLYKSKSIRPKDEKDFQIVKEKLDESAKKWLNDALKKCYGRHKWISV